MLMEIGVDSHCHIVADTHHGTKGIGTQTHMSVLTHSLEALTLLLHRIIITTETINHQISGLNLAALSCTLTFHQCTLSTDTSTCSNIFQQLLVKLRGVNHNLHIIDGRTIVQCNEVDCLGRTVCTHPTFHTNFLSVFRALQHVNDLDSFHCSF